MSFVTMMEGHLAWGDKPLLDNADLAVEPGQRIGLIGRNGTGKRTSYTERPACRLRRAGAVLSGSADRHGFVST